MKLDGSPSVRSGKMVLAIVTVLTFCALTIGITQFFVPRHNQSWPTRLREGRVYDAVTGQPVPGAKVDVVEMYDRRRSIGKNPKKPHVINAEIGVDGCFTVDIPKEWAKKGYSVYAKAEGYLTVALHVCPDLSLLNLYKVFPPVKMPLFEFSYKSLPENMPIELHPRTPEIEKMWQIRWDTYRMKLDKLVEEGLK